MPVWWLEEIYLLYDCMPLAGAVADGCKGHTVIEGINLLQPPCRRACHIAEMTNPLDQFIRKRKPGKSERILTSALLAGTGTYCQLRRDFYIHTGTHG